MEIGTPEHLRLKDSSHRMGVVERNEEKLADWMLNKLGEFVPFLGLSYEDFKEEILGLFRKIVMKRERSSNWGGGGGIEFGVVQEAEK